MDTRTGRTGHAHEAHLHDRTRNVTTWGITHQSIPHLSHNTSPFPLPDPSPTIFYPYDETCTDPTHYRHAYCLLDNCTHNPLSTRLLSTGDNCTHMFMKQLQIQPIIDTLTGDNCTHMFMKQVQIQPIIDTLTVYWTTVHT